MKHYLVLACNDENWESPIPYIIEARNETSAINKADKLLKESAIDTSEDRIEFSTHLLSDLGLYYYDKQKILKALKKRYTNWITMDDWQPMGTELDDLYQSIADDLQVPFEAVADTYKQFKKEIIKYEHN